MFFRSTAVGYCPGGFCNFIKDFSEVLVVILCIDGFIFLITLVPPIFNWKTKKPDGKKRIWFAALACVTFYFWLAFLALNTIYCFGFLAHEGPCKGQLQTTGNLLQPTAVLNNPQIHPSVSPTAPFVAPTDFQSLTSTSTSSKAPPPPPLPTTSDPEIRLPPWPSPTIPTLPNIDNQPLTVDPPLPASPNPPSYSDPDSDYGNGTEDYGGVEWQQPQVQPLITWTASNSTKMCSRPASEHENELKNLTLANILIIVVLALVLLANAREAVNAKALYHKEMLCKKDEVQKFLSSLVLKPPEVGHLVNCFHIAKSVIDTKNKKSQHPIPAASKDNKDGVPRKVITFSAIENFEYQTWRDFSDLRLIEPSDSYPVIEVEIALNFFPGDHFTAERYKEFVQQLTKQHQGKDAKISIDDYFHVEDHREWTFFIGNPNYINPWWDKFPAKLVLSCIFLIGWPFRLSYKGRIGKHVVEVKKAVFVEYSSQDEGVSLSATPGSNSNHNNNNSSTEHNNNPKASEDAACANDNSREDSLDNDNEDEDDEDSLTNKNSNVATSRAQQNSDAVLSRLDSDPQMSARQPQKNEHRVDAVISCPPRDVSSPDGVDNPSWQGQQYIVEKHQHSYRHPMQQQVNPQQERVVQELQQHIQQQQHHQQQQHQQQQQNRYVFQMQDASRNPQITGPSLPTTLGSVAAGFGRNSTHNIAYQGHHPLLPSTPPMPPQRSAPLTSPRTHLRETTKEIVTAVAHSDINGLSSAVNTVALKDIDIQLSALSGYETYV